MTKYIKKETLVTTGTHDLSLISGNFIYDKWDPNDISLKLLGKGGKLISAFTTFMINFVEMLDMDETL